MTPKNLTELLNPAVFKIYTKGNAYWVRSYSGGDYDKPLSSAIYGVILNSTLGSLLGNIPIYLGCLSSPNIMQDTDILPRLLEETNSCKEQCEKVFHSLSKAANV